MELDDTLQYRLKYESNNKDFTRRLACVSAHISRLPLA